MPAAVEPQASASGRPTISFGPFRLVPAQRLLLEGGAPVRLGSRAFDILTALVERAGEIVSKEELIARAWPQTFVEETNLKIQVSALRRALGDGQGDNRYVATVVGRGYNFVAPIHEDVSSPAPPSATIAPAVPHNLPFATTRMIGREATVTTLVTELAHQRLVTVSGPGGIGKTTVALAVAERMIGAFEDGVWLVDLAPIRDAGLVPSAVATVLGLEIRTTDPTACLVAALRDRRLLLLLDSCEHVIDAAASLVAAILSGTSGVAVLATSREPLGVQGERMHRLGPLNTPEPSPGLTAREAAAFPAIQLFVERVTAIVEDFVLTDANAPLVVAICRRLDGLPLAIEFAAPRVEVLGIERLAAGLDDRLRVLGTQRRAPVARHRTMQAAVDWSYGLLSQDEQRFFRALGVFAGGFTGEAAAVVAMDAARTGTDALDSLADLVAKSLVVADVSGAKPRFRLLDTIRAFALEKLDESGERETMARVHAGYYRMLFEHVERETTTRAANEEHHACAQEIDNLRAALDWAFSPDGDRLTGVALINAAFPLWMRLSLLEECRSRAKQAFAVLRAEDILTPREQMRLHAALGASTSDPSEMRPALTKTLELARSLGDVDYQLRALRGLYFYHAGNSQYRIALPVAQTFHDLVASGPDTNDRLFGERTIGAAKHFIGDQAGARWHLEEVLSHRTAATPGQKVVPFQDIVRFGTDLRVSARTFLARVLWLQGFPDQAADAAETAVTEALAAGHAQSLCYTLTLGACQVALWTGDLATARRHTEMLVDHAGKHSLLFWGELGARLLRVVNLKADNIDPEPRPPPAGDDGNRSARFNFLIVLGEVADALARAGQTEGALQQIDQGIGQGTGKGIDGSDADWLTPELLRLKGELLLAGGTYGAVEAAEQLFSRARDEARRQGALSWELRATTSLAGLLRDRGRPADAIACLRPVHDRFTEGFRTADLIAAKRLLSDLSGAGRR